MKQNTNAQNMTTAAKLLGVTRQTLSNWRKDGCPGFNANGTVNVAEVEAWSALAGKDAGKQPAELTAARVRLLTAQAERTERDNKLKNADAIDISEVRRVTSEVSAMMFNELERFLMNDLPPMAKGRTELEIHGLCKKFYVGLSDTFRAKVAALAGVPATELEAIKQRKGEGC